MQVLSPGVKLDDWNLRQAEAEIAYKNSLWSVLA
jgi:hypothetical protein